MGTIIFKAYGRNGSITLYRNHLVIRKNTRTLKSNLISAVTEIYLNNIHEINFEYPSDMTLGFIQFETKSIHQLAEYNLSASHLMAELITDHAIFLEERLYLLQFMSSKERYDALIKRVPEVSQKVSLTDIASFLGVSRETVSRIRSKK